VGVKCNNLIAPDSALVTITRSLLRHRRLPGNRLSGQELERRRSILDPQAAKC
jgi:hypothetical protein